MFLCAKNEVRWQMWCLAHCQPHNSCSVSQSTAHICGNWGVCQALSKVLKSDKTIKLPVFMGLLVYQGLAFFPLHLSPQ